MRHENSEVGSQLASRGQHFVMAERPLVEEAAYGRRLIAVYDRARMHVVGCSLIAFKRAFRSSFRVSVGPLAFQ
jgi:hypothetical protein